MCFHQFRVRRKPAYLNDYVTGQESEEEAELQSLAVFSTISDPVTYEEAVKHEEWTFPYSWEIYLWDLNSC